MSEPNSPIWTGVYRNFNEVPGQLNQSFTSPRWLDVMEQQFHIFLQDGPERTTTQRFETLVSAVGQNRTPQELAVLDFGGGMGAAYASLVRQGLADHIQRFVIVENPEVCARGRSLNQTLQVIEYSPDLPDVAERFDLVHFGSSFHYVQDWKELLVKIAAFQPSRILFEELPVGAIKHSFVTAQNYYGDQIPVWFFQQDELVHTLKGLGYVLEDVTDYEGYYHSEKIKPPMDNLPENLRLDCFKNLIFIQD